jgi:hypothetical protein
MSGLPHVRKPVALWREALTAAWSLEGFFGLVAFALLALAFAGGAIGFGGPR